jgi:hypothetical protein
MLTGKPTCRRQASAIRICAIQWRRRVSWMIAGLVAQAARREESPDTTLRMEMPGEGPALQERRATLRPAFAGPWVKGNAPGNARGAAARRATVHGKCHREDTASVAYPGDSLKENLRDVFQWIATKVRVKRWGKSPPLRQQWRRQGKPRVVQDQIGGQSRPGSLSELERASSLSCCATSVVGAGG